MLETFIDNARKVGGVRKVASNPRKRKLDLIVTPKRKNKPRAAKKKQQRLVFTPQEEGNLDDAAVDAQFEDSEDELQAETGMSPDGVVSYDCLNCKRSMRSLQQCYPETERKDGLIFYCKRCHESKLAMDNMVVQIEHKAQQDREKKRQSLPSGKGKGDGKGKGKGNGKGKGKGKGKGNGKSKGNGKGKVKVKVMVKVTVKVKR